MSIERVRALAPVVLAAALAGCGGPPPLGDDREAFKAVDALYTAVSMRDARQTEGCVTTLHALRDSGKLPGSAAATLDAIADEARGGGWEGARGRLRTFMLGQRR